MSEDDLRAEVRRLRTRVTDLEVVLRSAVCAVAGALLVIGALVPYLDLDIDGTLHKTSLLTMGYHVASDGSNAIPVSVGYYGLMAVTLAALVVLVQVAGTASEGPGRRLVATVLALLGTGTVIALLFGLGTEASSDAGEFHATMGWFIAGVIAFGLATRAPVATLGRQFPARSDRLR